MNAISVPDPDLEISRVGRSSRLSDKGKWGEGGGPLAGSAAAFPFSFPPEIG